MRRMTRVTDIYIYVCICICIYICICICIYIYTASHRKPYCSSNDSTGWWYIGTLKTHMIVMYDNNNWSTTEWRWGCGVAGEPIITIPLEQEFLPSTVSREIMHEQKRLISQSEGAWWWWWGGWWWWRRRRRRRWWFEDEEDEKDEE